MNTGPLGLPKTLQLDSRLVLKIIDIIDCCHYNNYPENFSKDVEYARVSLQIKMMEKSTSQLFSLKYRASNEKERLEAEEDIRKNYEAIEWYKRKLRAMESAEV